MFFARLDEAAGHRARTDHQEWGKQSAHTAPPGGPLPPRERIPGDVLGWRKVRMMPVYVLVSFCHVRSGRLVEMCFLWLLPCDQGKGTGNGSWRARQGVRGRGII